MKQCPTCQLSYSDRLKFCRYDGTALVIEPSLPEEAPTIRFTPSKISEQFPWLEERANTDRNRLLRETQGLDSL